MSSVRQRGYGVSPTGSPSIDNLQGLSAALKQVREAALAGGLSQEKLSHCVSTLVKTKLKVQQNVKKPQLDLVPKNSNSCCSKLYRCFKVMWIVWLSLLAVSTVVMLHRPSGHLIHNLLHRHMYKITRPLRLAIITVVPYLNTIGWNVLDSDCLVMNPLVNESMSCPCMYIKQTVELQLNETQRTLPRDILSIPNNKVYVLRNAVKGLTNFSLDVFEQYHGRMFPNMCFEMPGDSENGVQEITELFNKRKVNQYLDHPEQPWSYSWQECPSQENPLTFHSHLPPWEWLPPDITVSNSSTFTLSSQWSRSEYIPVDDDVDEGFVAVLVLLGEIRVLMESSNPNCQYNCVSFGQHPILGPGDILLFDQTYWDYHTVTWTRASFTSTVGLAEH